MKKIVLLLLALVFVFPACAPAEDVSTPALTLTLPQGWTSSADSVGNLTFTAPSGATVTLTAQEVLTEQDKADLDPQTVASYLATQLREAGAAVGDVTVENGVASFTSGSDASTVFRFSTENDRWSVMIVIRNKPGDPTVKELLDSVRYN